MDPFWRLGEPPGGTEARRKHATAARTMEEAGAYLVCVSVVVVVVVGLG
jgi:hypothetical protein